METMCTFGRNVYVRGGVLLKAEHFLFLPVGLIIKAAAVCFPSGFPVWITRGAEQCPGGKKNSKHLICHAFDFGTEHLPESVDRMVLKDRMQAGLGPEYYLYYKKFKKENGITVEWIHAQYNGARHN